MLSDEPLFVILNSYTTGLAPSVATYILETLLSRKFGGRTDSQELGLPRHRERPGPALRRHRALEQILTS